MSRRQIVWCAETVVLVLWLFVGVSVLTARQEPAKPVAEKHDAKLEKKEDSSLRQQGEGEAKRGKAEAELDRMFAEYDLKPHGLPAIPDNPPPHEGAMLGYPVVIEPPDLLLVEVLEALPGRPISGERLVRQDGAINLGFYGDVHVAGLTLKQAKVKIIQHLRPFLKDEELGLYELELTGEEERPGDVNHPRAIPPMPPTPHEMDPFGPEQDKQPKAEPSKPRTVPSGYKVRSVARKAVAHSYLGRRRPRANIRQTARLQETATKKTEEPQQDVKIPLGAGGKVTITVEGSAGDKKEKEEIPVLEEDWVPGPAKSPEHSDRVFVDITAYNSKNYYVTGDVAQPGHLPFTGHETVMDALDYAGGLLPTAEPKDIRLVRPARGGKPAKTYKVDLEAIRAKGDVTSNYQVFPGDRLIVGRNEVVKRTVQVDRLASGMQTVVNSIMQESFMLRSLQTTSPENHETILKTLVDFWIQEMKRPDGVVFEEQTLREALIQELKPKPEKKK